MAVTLSHQQIILEIQKIQFSNQYLNLQLLKMRANVRFDEQMAIGRWINCSSPLTIKIIAQSTFLVLDHSGKSMLSHGYSSKELDYPIQDIWLIKKK